MTASATIQISEKSNVYVHDLNVSTPQDSKKKSPAVTSRRRLVKLRATAAFFNATEQPTVVRKKRTHDTLSIRKWRSRRCHDVREATQKATPCQNRCNHSRKEKSMMRRPPRSMRNANPSKKQILHEKQNGNHSSRLFEKDNKPFPDDPSCKTCNIPTRREPSATINMDFERSMLNLL